MSRILALVALLLAGPAAASGQSATDTDNDGIPNTWEQFFGLDPNDPADAIADPDSDGRTNLQEFLANTHPRGLASATRFFAEGVASDFFATRFSLANPSATQAATVLMRHLRPNGTSSITLVSVPPLESRRVLANLQPALQNTEFATVIETDRPVVANRLMWWASGNAYGSHAERAMRSAATTWYFAEGSTVGAFDLFYLLQNPGDDAATVEAQFLLPSGAPVIRTYTVPAHARSTIWVDSIPALASTDLSAVFTVQLGPAILVERSMYLSTPTQTFAAGHESAGVTTPALEWSFAEGATGPFFDLFLLLSNPGTDTASAEVTYLLTDGSTRVKTYTIAPRSRFNVWVDEERFAGAPALANAAMSMVVRSVNHVPIVAERAMWWPGSSATWVEAHGTAGTPVTSPRWVVAEGEIGAPPGNTETFYLITNRSTFATDVRVTLLFADGTAALSKTFPVLATSRFSVDVRQAFPAAAGKAFGAIIESITTRPAGLVVEWAIYNDNAGVHWAAGAAALADPQ